MKGTCTLLWMWYTLHTGRELPCMCDKNLKRPMQLAHYFGCGTQHTLSTRSSHTGPGWTCSDQCVSKLESTAHIFTFIQTPALCVSSSVPSRHVAHIKHMIQFWIIKFLPVALLFNWRNKTGWVQKLFKESIFLEYFWPTDYPSPCFWNTSGQTSIPFSLF
jgi:hypothetical protein